MSIICAAFCKSFTPKLIAPSCASTYQRFWVFPLQFLFYSSPLFTPYNELTTQLFIIFDSTAHFIRQNISSKVFIVSIILKPDLIYFMSNIFYKIKSSCALKSISSIFGILNSITNLCLSIFL